MGLIIDLLGITLCMLVLGSAQLYAASVFIHHTGHGKGIGHAQKGRPKWLGKLVAEFVGILLLRQSVSAYLKEHGIHHGKDTFARGGLDPDATFIYNLGFRVGDTVGVSNRRLKLLFVSPRVHGKLILQRLLMNFARKEEPIRTLVAWIVWALILLFASIYSDLIAFWLFLLLSMVMGNIASMLELFSRHKWLIEVATDVQSRQWVLSHARFYGTVPPESGSSYWIWIQWVGNILQATSEKLLVGAGDLQWHISHHVRWDEADYEGQPAWVNPQYAYASHIAELSDDKVYLSTNSAIQAWFKELAEA